MNYELKQLLAQAYPCPALCECCSEMRYAPQSGLVPRGYCGATKSLAEVELVICVAEPGEPLKDGKETYDVSGKTLDVVERVAAYVGGGYKSSPNPYHANIRFLLHECWPGLSFEEMMIRTWITEGVLCSAGKTTGHVHKKVEAECADRYLKRQFAMLPQAFVIALGRKAERRLSMADIKFHASGRAAGLPAGRKPDAKASWIKAAEEFRAFRSQREIPNRA